MPDDTTRPRKRPTRWYDWWPLLLGLLVSVGVAGANAIWPGTMVLHKTVSEKIAIGATGLTAALAIFLALRSRRATSILLAALASIVLAREIHIRALDPAVYGSLVALGVWGFLWRDRAVPDLLAQPRLRVWLVATAVTYVLSQFIARRGPQHVFGDLPLAEFLETHQSSIEEAVENAAHLMLLVTVCVNRSPRSQS